VDPGEGPGRGAELDALLATLARALAHTALLLHPIMPVKARLVWETLRLEPSLDRARSLPTARCCPPRPPAWRSGPRRRSFPHRALSRAGPAPP